MAFHRHRQLSARHCVQRFRQLQIPDALRDRFESGGEVFSGGGIIHLEVGEDLEGSQVEACSVVVHADQESGDFAIRVAGGEVIDTIGRLSSSIHSLKIFGITDPARLHERAPTVSFVHDRLTPVEIADRLGEQGLFIGHGNFHALQFTETLGLEPDGVSCASG